MTVAQRDHYHLLLVEDDDGDAGLVRIAVRRGRHPCTLHHVKSGLEALAFLRRIGEFRDAPRPDLVLLDLNLPGKSGHEVIEEIKGDRVLRGVPLVVFSTSEAERDVNKAYQLGANSFISKPMDVEAFAAAIAIVQSYWFDIARLPG